MECPVCDGKNPECTFCKGNVEGIAIDHCPSRYITPEINQVRQLANFIEEGNLPLSGGVLDQPKTLMDAIETFRYELSNWRNKKRG